MKPMPHGPPQTRRASYALLSFLLALSACSPEPNWVGAPRVPTPVLLGPVDRVGGHRGDDDAKAVSLFRTSVNEVVTVSRSETQSGNTVIVRTERTFSRDGTGKLSVDLLRSTEGDTGRDARVRELDLATFCVNLSAYAQSQLSVDVAGDVVRAPRGAR